MIWSAIQVQRSPVPSQHDPLGSEVVKRHLVRKETRKRARARLLRRVGSLLTSLLLLPLS